MSTETIRIMNPLALDLEPFKKLFDRAFASEEHGDPEKILAFLKAAPLGGDYAVLVADDADSGLVGLAILQNAPWVFSAVPWCLHFHAETGAATEALGGAIREWMVENGLASIRILNQTGRSDEAHMRLFSRFGDPVLVGSVIDYTVRKTETETETP